MLNVNLHKDILNKNNRSNNDLAQETYEQHLKDLRYAHGVQGLNGNWNWNPYMMGLYNGLELALSIFEDREPAYKEQPKVFISEKQELEKKENSKEKSLNQKVRMLWRKYKG